MSYRNERFANSMHSLDSAIEGIDIAKVKQFSDNELGVQRMIDAIDYDDAQETRNEKRRDETKAEKLFNAEMRLAEVGKGYLIRVLLLIIENGNNREESCAKVARRTYYRHREELLKFFRASHCTARNGEVEGAVRFCRREGTAGNF